MIEIVLIMCGLVFAAYAGWSVGTRYTIKACEVARRNGFADSLAEEINRKTTTISMSQAHHDKCAAPECPMNREFGDVLCHSHRAAVDLGFMQRPSR